MTPHVDVSKREEVFLKYVHKQVRDAMARVKQAGELPPSPNKDKELAAALALWWSWADALVYYYDIQLSPRNIDGSETGNDQ